MAPAPAPAPSPGECHVWLRPNVRPSVGPNGSGRAEVVPAIRSGEDADVLSGLVARYLGPRGRWELARRCAVCGGPHGKPYVVVDGGRSPLEVSVSHSAPVSAYAFATAGPIGVDVEAVQPRFDWAAVAHMVASPGERRLLDQARPEVRSALFHRMWVAKEAVLKADGAGLAGPVREVDTSASPGVVWDGWYVQPLDLGGAVAGALASRSGLLEVSLFDAGDEEPGGAFDDRRSPWRDGRWEPPPAPRSPVRHR